MKKLFLSAITIALAASAYAIPNTFSEGDVISAEQMNENFESLVNSSQIRETNVNCNDGATIAGAIEKGFNSITVSGTCAENLQFSMWREDSAENGTPTGKLAPRFLKISGADANAKIADTSSNTESTLSVYSGATLFLENIAVSGGEYGINVQRNSNLYLSGVTVESFSGGGLRVADSAWLGVDDGGVTISGGTDASYGILLVTGSSGWIHTSNISNVETGISIYGQSFTYLYNFTIEASQRGIAIGDHSTVVRYEDGAGLITGTSDRAIDAWQGNFYSWSPGSLTIQNLQGGRAISTGRGGNIKIHNLNIPDFNNVGSGWNPAIEVGVSSNLELEGPTISGSTDGPLIRIDSGSVGRFRDLTLSGSSSEDNLISIQKNSTLELRDSEVTITSGQAAIELYGSSFLEIGNSKITGDVSGKLIGTWEGSASNIADSTLTINSGDTGLETGASSHLNIRNSTITGDVSDRLIGVYEGSSAEIQKESTLTVTSTDNGLDISGGSRLEFKNTTLNGTVDSGCLVCIHGSSSAEIRDSTVTLNSGEQAASVKSNSHLKIRSSTISGTATKELVDVRRVSHAIIDGSTLSQTSSDTPDVRVSKISFLSVFDDSSINSVDCHMKGTVDTDVSITDLDSSCTE